jgi:hypothetical protein
MKVLVLNNKRDPNLRIAFVKGMTKKLGEISVPAYFDKNIPVDQLPAHGEEVEVMICGVLFPKYEKGQPNEGHFNFNAVPKCFFIRQPTDEIKVRYDGFECSGSMCQTTTSAIELLTKKRHYVITPGKLMSYLVVADNVSSATEYNEPIPGIGWIKHNPENGKMRLEGVDSLAELEL